jgi:polyhydroxybutyrate depolymerase
VSFVSALIDKLALTERIDPSRVFLAGYSGGGQLAFRFALERPERVAAIAAFSANLPTPDDLVCLARGEPVPALLINGTRDRIIASQAQGHRVRLR